MIDEDSRFIYTQKFIYRCPQGHMVLWINSFVSSRAIPKKSVTSILGESSGERLPGDN